jgi:hypothetical protein
LTGNQGRQNDTLLPSWPEKASPEIVSRTPAFASAFLQASTEAGRASHDGEVIAPLASVDFADLVGKLRSFQLCDRQRSE